MSRKLDHKIRPHTFECRHGRREATVTSRKKTRVQIWNRSVSKNSTYLARKVSQFIKEFIEDMVFRT